MKIMLRLLIIGLLFLIFGCTRGISGTVVDAETGKPIEGAVVLVEWDVTEGAPGLTYTRLAKQIETLTDSNGNFTVKADSVPFTSTPQLLIYKKGYVAWRNDWIFPDWDKRTDFKWRNNQIYRLERFEEGQYLHSDHEGFINSGINAFRKSSSKLSQAFEKERILAQKEHELYAKIRSESLKQGEKKTESQIWKEVVKKLYSSGKEE